MIYEYITFKNECADIVSYISNIELIDISVKFKSNIENAKAEFRLIRDKIMNGVKGNIASQKVNIVLTKIKDEYIDIYFEEHNKKRLNIDEAKRRGIILESGSFANLRKLRTIDILSAAKLTELEQDIASLKVCYELTTVELKTTHMCPHCRFSLNDKENNVFGQLDNFENRINNLISEWTNVLINTISDPLVLNQKEFLTTQQVQVVDDFVLSKELPKQVDDFFVNSINTLLKGFEPVVIEVEDLVQKLDEMPPCDVDTFKSKINQIISSYINGKDLSKLRIVVKRRESEE